MAAKPSTKTASPDDAVRQLSTADYLSAAQALAEAFADDVLSRYFVDVPDRAHWTEAEKWALHLAITQYITYAHCMKGIVTTAGPDYASVALWMPPGANMDDLKTVLLSGLWRLHYKLSPTGRRRFFKEFFPVLHATKAAVLGARDNDAYYLVYIGTRPAGRGRGHARRLIDHMLARADAERRPVYLESTSALNVPLYRRCGFDVVRRIAMGDVGRRVELDIMVREPRAAVDVLGSPAAQPRVKVHITATAKKHDSIISALDEDEDEAKPCAPVVHAERVAGSLAV